MKTFGIFIKKEFWHIFRDKRTLLILFGIGASGNVKCTYALGNCNQLNYLTH